MPSRTESPLEGAPIGAPVRLVSLTTSGFRVFVEPCRVTFTDGITVLAGPNGAGKSTVLDVLGMAFARETPFDLNEFPSFEAVLEFDDGSDIRVTGAQGKVVLEERASVPVGLPKGVSQSTIPELKAFGATGSNKSQLVESAKAILSSLSDDMLEKAWIPITDDTSNRLPRLVRFDSESAEDLSRTVDELIRLEFQHYANEDDARRHITALRTGFAARANESIASIRKAVVDGCGELVAGIEVDPGIEIDRPRFTVSVTVHTADGEARTSGAFSLDQRRRMSLTAHHALADLLE
ncbi:AAA family ATPase [Mumia sp. ZJ430]|uniref:AAA family ATPase n=1 Tax=Mumia sp. ZJ430 TaxID=2708083 RepID=UPI00141D9E9F|nr:AAA family ATPase [Mumia sp. ZJ430]